MKKTFLSLAIIAVSTLSLNSCQNDSELLENKGSSESTAVAKSSETNSYKISEEIVKKVKEDINNNTFYLNNSYLSNISSSYEGFDDLSIENLISYNQEITLAEDMGIENYIQTLPLSDFTKSKLLAYVNGENITYVIHDPIYSSLPTNEQNILSNMVKLKNDYIAYNSEPLAKGGGDRVKVGENLFYTGVILGNPIVAGAGIGIVRAEMTMFMNYILSNSDEE